MTGVERRVVKVEKTENQSQEKHLLVNSRDKPGPKEERIYFYKNCRQDKLRKRGETTLMHKC